MSDHDEFELWLHAQPFGAIITEAQIVLMRKAWNASLVRVLSKIREVFTSGEVQ